MSARAAAWALQQTCGNSTTKLVLIILADVAGADGESHYGQKRLAAMAELTTRALRDHLKALERLGLLARSRRSREDGSRTSDSYVLAVPPPPEESSARKGDQAEAERRANRKLASGLDPLGFRKEEEVEEESGELFEDPEPVRSLVDEMSRLVRRLGNRRWPLKSLTQAEWCRDLARDPEFAGLDLAKEAKECGEHWEPKVNGKAKAPHSTFKRWLRKALQIRADSARRNGGSADGVEAFADAEARRFESLRRSQGS